MAAYGRLSQFRNLAVTKNSFATPILTGYLPAIPMLAALDRQPNIFRARLSTVSLIGMFLDPVIIIGTLFICAYYYGEDLDGHYFILALIAFSLSFPGTSHFNDSRGQIIRDVVGGWLSLAALLFFFGYASASLNFFSRDALFAWLVAAPAALMATHLLARAIFPRVLAMRGNQRAAVIVGMGETGVRLAQQIRKNPYLGTRLIGYFDDRNSQRLSPLADGNMLLGSFTNLAQFVKENRIDIIYITLPMATQPRILAMLNDMRDTTASIYFVPDIFITDLIQGRMDTVGGMPVVAVCETPFTGVNGLVKRSSDIIFSLLILALISPLMLIIALAVKLGSPGPVFFMQRRSGVDGKEILVYKFRSMTVCEDGAHIAQATKNDKRITPLGAFLRKTSLDELPQFINVLQGRMSIVGPRPHALAHNELYRKVVKSYMIRHKVKPGITGWAQVNGYRGETDKVEKMQKRVEYDLEYLRDWSLGLDLWIILKTVVVVLNDRHAY